MHEATGQLHTLAVLSPRKMHLTLIKWDARWERRNWKYVCIYVNVLFSNMSCSVHITLWGWSHMHSEDIFLFRIKYLFETKRCSGENDFEFNYCQCKWLTRLIKGEHISKPVTQKTYTRLPRNNNLFLKFKR